MTAVSGIATVLFICDFPPGFDGARFHGAGVGGTEAMVVVLAEALAERGLRVSVATQVGEPRSHAGVSYVSVGTRKDADLVVLVKRWSEAASGLAGRRVFVATDVHIPDRAGLQRSVAWAGCTAAVSSYMRERLSAAVDVSRMGIIAPPIRMRDYASTEGNRPQALLYCSVPDRGLFYMKDIFPAIRRRVPGATLAITSDFSLWGRPAARDAFLRFFDGQPGVEYLGHVPRSELVEAQRRARVMTYPCLFEEGFCISAAECMAAGTVPVTTNAFALTTTVGDAGVLVNGRPRSWFYRRAFVKATVRLLTDEDEWQRRSAACRAHAAALAAPQVAASQLLALAAQANGAAW